MDINRINSPELPTNIFSYVANDVVEGNKLWGRDVSIPEALLNVPPLFSGEVTIKTEQSPAALTKQRVIQVCTDQKPAPDLPSTPTHIRYVKVQTDEEKKRQIRRIKNRAAAEKSRDKKKEKLENLENQVKKLSRENYSLKELLSKANNDLSYPLTKLDQYDHELNELKKTVGECYGDKNPLKRSISECEAVTEPKESFTKHDDTAASWVSLCEAKIIKLETELSDRNASISGLKGELLTYQATVTRLKKELRGRDEAINKLKATFRNFETKTS